MATPFMNLTLPVVTTTLGPAWASELNVALEFIDSHDHSSGSGTQIRSSSINIDDVLSFGDFSITDLNSVKFRTDLGAPLAGASNAASVYVSGGDLYYTNSAGVAVQVTSGGSIVTSPGAVDSYQYDAVSSDLVIAAVDTFVFLAIDTSVARTITLPGASAVTAGRLYILKDSTGTANTNNISIATSGADTIDGAASDSITSDYGSVQVISNGVDGWYIA